jgi:hypothetical protein
MLIRSEVGLLPADNDTREWFAKLRIGASVLAKVVQPRNPAFHRKFFALLQYGFEHWAETQQPQEYKGEAVQPNFERFRKDITILAGYGRPVVNIRGDVRMEADSISFGSMSAETFEKLYSAVIDVLLTRVFKGPQWTERELRDVVDGLVEFA